MSAPIMTHEAHHHDVSHDTHSKTIFGFWLYLMTDCIFFASIFAAYAVLQNATFGGPTARDFSLPLALMETLVLLTSSFTCGASQVAANRDGKKTVLVLLGVTFLLGSLFAGMVWTEFTQIVQSGNTWRTSAFLSAYFTLVGTILIHIVFGLLWMLVVMAQIVFRGLRASTHRRLTCLRLFWHFINIVWIFIFSVVYLMGAI